MGFKIPYKKPVLLIKNRSIGRLPFQIVYENSPRNASELRKLNKGEISSTKAEDFAEYIKSIHEEVRQHLIKMNT